MIAKFEIKILMLRCVFSFSYFLSLCLQCLVVVPVCLQIRLGEVYFC